MSEKNLIDKILLQKVKENGIVKLIRQFIPDEYLVITESIFNSSKLTGNILFLHEIDDNLHIEFKKLNTFFHKVKPYTHYEFIIYDKSYVHTEFIETNSVIKSPTFQIKCALYGNFQASRRNGELVKQCCAEPCGRCLDRGSDCGFYHIDDLYHCEYYNFLCQECRGNQFCACDYCNEYNNSDSYDE